jgi:two-component system LytT family response regulator
MQEMARAVQSPVAQTVPAASSAPPKVRTLIVDDESLARRALRRCLDQFSAIEVVGESESGSDALNAIQTRKPELVFLDIEMPGLSGLDVVSRLEAESIPVIVFVTGHDQYALDAFRAHALDFVMKPLDERRIGDIMERVLKQVRLRRLDGMEQRLQSVLHALEQRGNGTGTTSVGGAGLQKLAVKENGRIRLLEVPSIDWIEASGNYVTLHIGPSKHLVRETMNAMERRLEPGQFLRIHRSTMVNPRSVVEFRTSVNGSFLVVLKDQTRLFSSRGYRANVERFLSAMR